ncbi:MAG TPA: site-specific integrase [Polyangiaceae bacterium]|jgi:integrase
MHEETGTLLRTATGKPFAQFTIGPKKRVGAILEHVDGDVAALKKKHAIGAFVERLREAGHTRILRNIIREACAADADGLRKVRELVARIIAGKEPGLAGGGVVAKDGMTIARLAELWYTGELATLYPDHVRVKRTSADDRRLFKWMNLVRMPEGDTFGARTVASVTLDDLDHVMANLPKTTSTAGARRQYAQSLRRLFVYARYPLRLRDDLPVPTGWLPKTKERKAKAWLYPSELAALERDTRAPLWMRLVFGLCAREGFRIGEACALTIDAIDFVHGVVRLDENKTDDPRSWALGPDVVAALATWVKKYRRGARKTASLFVTDEGTPPTKRYQHVLATELRERLEKALAAQGMKMRSELTTSTKARMKLRVHDLRGSFVTVALACGKSESWCTDRTGHRSSQMIYTYKRNARTAAEVGCGWFLPLDETIPELAGDAPKSTDGGANEAQTDVPRGREMTLAIANRSAKRRLATSQNKAFGVQNPPR